jgi:L-amino acid N-acyltransferase YncA
MLSVMMIREANLADWPAIWPFMRPIIAAGETFSWDRDTSEDEARASWFRWRNQPAGHTIVATGPDGTVLGTAEMGPSHGGPAAHIASASCMVDPARARQGVGRALGQHVLDLACAENYRAMQFNAVVEANTAAVALWRALGFDVLATIPDGFCHPVRGYVGLHIMHRRL